MSTSLHIYNTLSRKKEPFVPVKKGHVGMYACGLTPYDHPHLGHILSAIRFDVIRRYLHYRGYWVEFVENTTDVDDKIITRAKERNVRPSELVEPFIAEYEHIRAKFNLLPPTYFPRISRYIPQTIAYINTLIENKAAYVTDKGNVYFSVASAGDYGTLSGTSWQAAEESGRVESEPDKRDVHDFALWKADDTSGATWQSPWGRGRPGWHIECSVMAQEILGKRFDIHAGGMDLVFPHHENERAQAIAKTGKESFAQYWIHSGVLSVDGKKMSKSLGNSIPAEDALLRYGAELLKFSILRFHYRSPVPFSEQLLRDNLNTVKMCAERLADITLKERFIYTFFPPKAGEAFEMKMDDDFNTPEALVSIVSNLENGGSPSIAKAQFAVLGLFQRDKDEILEELLTAHRHLSDKQVPTLSEVRTRLKERDAVRATRNFKESDRIRDELSRRGIKVLDTPLGSDWQFDIGNETSKM